MLSEQGFAVSHMQVSPWCPFSIDVFFENQYSSPLHCSYLFSNDMNTTGVVKDDLDKFCCPNKDCSKFGLRGEKNISVRDTYGPQDTRLLWCRSCDKRFSERRGTIFFDSRLPEEKVISIIEHVTEGCGMRKTGRLTGVKPDTVSRYTKLAGKHSEQLHDELVAFSPSDRRSSV
jgi:transposase-like protein